MVVGRYKVELVAQPGALYGRAALVGRDRYQQVKRHFLAVVRNQFLLGVVDMFDAEFRYDGDVSFL